jgi:hypothetical protein
MGEALIIATAVAAVVVVLVLASRIRRTPTIGGGEMSGAPENEARASVEAARIPGRSVVVRRIKVTGQPTKETITIDGVQYGSIDEIQDPKVRDQIRSALHDVPSEIGDPAIREQVERELVRLGIEDRANADADNEAGAGGEPAGT